MAYKIKGTLCKISPVDVTWRLQSTFLPNPIQVQTPTIQPLFICSEFKVSIRSLPQPGVHIYFTLEEAVKLVKGV